MFDTLAGMVKGTLDLAAVRSRPVAMAETRRLEVQGALGGLFPAGGLQRGSVVEVGGAAAVSLSLVVAAGVMPGGSSSSCWAAAVGFPSLGLVAASQIGVPLGRLALVQAPGERWAEVVAALVDGVDLILLAPPAGLRAPDARRLVARAKERGTVLVPVRGGGVSGCWPESPDLRLEVTSVEWTGLGNGHGHLQGRRVEVSLSGRRVQGGRRRSMELWLPGPDGISQVCTEAPTVVPTVVPTEVPAGVPAAASALTAVG